MEPLTAAEIAAARAAFTAPRRDRGAIRAFQQRLGVTADGIPGPVTMRALDALAAEPAVAPAPVEPIAPVASTAVPPPSGVAGGPAVGGTLGGGVTTPEAEVGASRTITPPDFAGSVAAVQALRPAAEDTRTARIAQLATSLLGGVATVAAGPSGGGAFGGLSAVLGGASRGAGSFADATDAQNEARMRAYQAALSDVVQKRIAGEADVYGQDVRAMTEDLNRKGRAEVSAADNLTAVQTTDALIEGRSSLQRQQDATDLLQGAQEAGDVEAARRYAVTAGVDPEAAASNATRVRADIDREEARLGRALTEAERYHRASIALGYTEAQERARANRAGERLEAGRLAEDRRQFDLTPRRGTPGGAAETPDEWLYKERNHVFRNRASYDSQDEYDAAVREIDDEYARRTAPQRTSGFRQMMGGTTADPLEGYDLTNPRIRAALAADPVLRRYLP